MEKRVIDVFMNNEFFEHKTTTAPNGLMDSCGRWLTFIRVFEFFEAENTVCERFISKIEPIEKAGSLIINNVKLTPLSEKYTLEVSTEEVFEHSGVAFEVFKIDYTAKNIGDNEFVLNIEII